MNTQWVTLQGEPVAFHQYLPEQHIADAILVHGFTGSKEDFQFIGPLLAKRSYHVIAIDNRGQHESPHSDRDDAYTVQSLARDVIELVDVLSLKKPHLFGHSLGGVIAQRAASIHPELFRSLTLMCSGPRARALPEFPLLALKEFPGRTMAELWNTYCAEEGNYTSITEMKKRRWLASDLRSVLTHADELIHFTSVVDQIAESKIPAHVFYGEDDDAWPFEMQLEMADQLSAEVHVIKGAGHCPNEDQPEITAEVIADFWDKN